MCVSSEYPSFAGRVSVISNSELAPGIFSLVVSAQNVPASLPGQFFMLRAYPSGVLLGRPISVYRHDQNSLTFLILHKGQGTAELCALKAGDSLDIIGPTGNSFHHPHQFGTDLSVAIIGGGIGIAPVAGFALTLPPQTFDFFACFRSSVYGLEGLQERAKNLTITTEDGSTGTKGMLPAVFKPQNYDIVYACGPTPMLRYVQEACKATSSSPAVSSSVTSSLANNGAARCSHVFLSLEERMACGAGACLGCTVRTVNGNKRCCVDGPIFLASEVLF